MLAHVPNVIADAQLVNTLRFVLDVLLDSKKLMDIAVILNALHANSKNAGNVNLDLYYRLMQHVELVLLIVEDARMDFVIRQSNALLTVHHAQAQPFVKYAKQDTISLKMVALDVTADAALAYGVQIVMLAMNHMCLNSIFAALLVVVRAILTFAGDVKTTISLKIINVYHAQVLALHAQREHVMAPQYALQDALNALAQLFVLDAQTVIILLEFSVRFAIPDAKFVNHQKYVANVIHHSLYRTIFVVNLVVHHATHFSVMDV